MAYIGIGYSGNDATCLREMVRRNSAWLNGDRIPRFYGDNFIVLYDSNTAREFVSRCRRQPFGPELTVYTMGNPTEI